MSRVRCAVLLAALLYPSALATADQIQGRARVWELGVTAGASWIDGGFNADFFGYSVQPSDKIPPMKFDNLDTQIETVGFRASYNFTRFFGVEIAGLSGETEVGDETQATLELDFTRLDRIKILNEQTAAVPGIEAAVEGIEYDYYSGHFTAVFNFNNFRNSKWVFYMALGGGGFSLDTDTQEFNDCLSGPDVIANVDPTLSPYNGDPDAPSTQRPDSFQDNPEQIASFDLGCRAAFPVAFQTQTQPDVIEVGIAVFNDTRPVMYDFVSVTPEVEQDLCSDFDPCKEEAPNFPGTVNQYCNLAREGSGLCQRDSTPSDGLGVTPMQQSCRLPNGSEEPCEDMFGNVSSGEPQFLTPPGILQDSGQRSVTSISSVTEWYYTAGGGVRWHFKPRHIMRLDVRRHFAEGINKDINEFTVGYSFLFGRGQDKRAARAALPMLPPDEGLPEAGEDTGEVEDDGGAGSDMTDTGDPPAPAEDPPAPAEDLPDPGEDDLPAPGEDDDGSIAPLR